MAGPKQSLRSNDLKLSLTIGYLYGDLMNIYGDTGNVVCLKRRGEWRGVEVTIRNISVGDNITHRRCDMYFFGGGQDQQQQLVSRDLVLSIKGKTIKKEVENGIPLLAICGGYQLLGDYYQPAEGKKIPGLGIFPAYTVASNTRMIGNIIIRLTANSIRLTANSQKPNAESLLVGFENHSGKTYLKEGAIPLGKVKRGFGNNGEDRTEGCIYKNAIGCYLHGSLLPKNPVLADWLLQTALEVKYGKKIKLKPLNDELESNAHQAAISRFS